MPVEDDDKKRLDFVDLHGIDVGYKQFKKNGGSIYCGGYFDKYLNPLNAGAETILEDFPELENNIYCSMDEDNENAKLNFLDQFNI